MYHAMGFTSFKVERSHIQFHNFKNKLLSFLKNFEKKTLITVIPIFVVLNVGISVIWIIQGRFRNSIAIYRGFWWNIVNLPKTLEKRKKIQALRSISDKEIFSEVEKNPRLSYYRYLFSDLGKYED
jgi:hypothetical protein